MICYYELLKIPQSATKQEIIKAYRAQALIHHPDKNPDRQAEATEYFAQLQEAFQTLSDDHERKFYDNHRAEILRGPIDKSQQGVSTEFMSSSDLVSYHSFKRYKSHAEFYTIFRELFIQIDVEEQKALTSDPFVLNPQEELVFYTFGDESTSAEQLLLFYNRFQSFKSVKSFYWFDIHRPMDYKDRKLRRIAEKENKEFREKARKEFNQAVYDLTMYVKKRDPRMKQILEEQRQKAELNKQKTLEKIEAERRNRLELGSQYVESDWTKVETSEVECIICDQVFQDDIEYQAHLDSTEHKNKAKTLKASFTEEKPATLAASVSNINLQTFNCEICEKEFDTEIQFSQHVNSKKHRMQLKQQKKK